MTFPLESLELIQGFFWILLRVSIILFMLPFFGARGIPTLWKVGVSMVIAIVITPVVPIPARFPQTVFEITLAMIAEVIMGLSLGLGVKMLFSAVQLAGQFMSFQMGFSMARAIDPNTGVQSTALSQFLYLFTVLIFFAIDGHHMFIRALARSFSVAPPSGLSFDPGLATVLIRTSARMFLIALKIAAPIMIALFLSNLCLGIVARTVPQVNILMIGFPLNIGLGLIFFGLTLSQLLPFLIGLTREIGATLMRMLELM